MRIALVTATFPPYRGGTGNVCLQNALQLARHGHEVHIFTPHVSAAAEVEQIGRLTVHRLRPLVRYGNASLPLGLFGMLRNYDLIHLHYPFFGGEMAALAAKHYGVPLVITYHQDVLLGGMTALFEKLLRFSVGRLALRSAAAVLFTSQDYGDASLIRPLLRGREQRIGVLPNGVDIQQFSPGPKPAELLDRYQLRQDERVALLVAGLDRAHAFKGVHVFLRALTLVPQSYKAVIVGDGDLRADYQAQARDLGLVADGAPRVHFAGRVSDQQLASYYRLADLTVLPSTTMGEAFGLVLLESLASATPVIASSLPGVRTVVAHEQDGLLVEPHNPAALAAALRSILSDEDARKGMGWRGRAKVEAGYSWEQIGRQLERIYAQVLEQGAPVLTDLSDTL